MGLTQYRAGNSPCRVRDRRFGSEHLKSLLNFSRRNRARYLLPIDDEEKTKKMPTLNLYTNVPVDAVTTSDILKDATKAVAKTIGKPESYVMILLNGGVPIAFAGTEGPAAYGELISIGGLGPSVNGKLSSIIADILQTKLSIDSSRFYIKFYDAQRSFFGFNGSTF